MRSTSQPMMNAFDLALRILELSCNLTVYETAMKYDD